MVFCMLVVGDCKEIPFPAVNPMSGYEYLTEMNIMTNSLEQLSISVITQLSLSTYSDGDDNLSNADYNVPCWSNNILGTLSDAPFFQILGNTVAYPICYVDFVLRGFSILSRNSYWIYWEVPMLFFFHIILPKATISKQNFWSFLYVRCF